MDLAGYVINAVLVEGRSVKEVCEAHGISRSWLYELIARTASSATRGSSRVEAAAVVTDTGVARVEDEIVALRKELTDLGVDAGAAHDPVPPQRRTGADANGAVGGHDLAGPPRGASSPLSPTSGRRARGGASRPSCPTSAGRPTSPTGPSPTAPTWRSSTSSTTTPACWSPPGRSSHQGRRRRRNVPPRRRRTGPVPASMLTDNGAIFTAATRNGPCAIETRAARPRHRLQALPPLPPPDLRQGRTLPPDPQEVARQAAPRHATSPNCKPSSTGSGPTTTPSAPTGPSAGAPPPRPSPPGPRPPPPTRHRRRRPNTASADDRVDNAGKVTLRYHSKLLHLGIGRRTPAPASCSSSPTATCAVITSDGELLAEFTIDPTKTYQTQKRPGQHA